MLAVELVLKGTVLLALVFAMATALRSASAATRHLVWALGLVGLVGLPLLSVATPWQLPVVPDVVRLQPADPDPAAAGAPAPAELGAAPAPTVSPHVEPVSGSPVTSGESAALGENAAPGGGPSVATILLLVWALGALLVSGRWLSGALSLRRCIRSARPVSGPGWDEPLRQASDRLLLDTPVRLLVSDRVPMPLTAGIVRPVVVLPEAAREWTADRRQAVIVHELAHIQRKDILSHALAWFACAAWWFHPLAWAAAKHLRAESERACDDLVLRAGTRPSSYADHLLDIVCHASTRRAPVPALPLAQPSEFEGRMLRILSPDARRHGLSALKALGLAVAFAAVAVPLAAIGVAPRAAAVAGDGGARENRSPARRVVDALLPESGERFVAETILGEKPDPDAASRSSASSDADSDADSDSDAYVSASKSAHGQAPVSLSGQEKARIVERLAASLSDSDAEVRHAAASALGELGDPRAVEALMRALRTDRDAGVRAMAAWALGQIEDARAVPALGEALRSDDSVEVRAKAAWALGEIESPQGVEYLRAAIRDANPEVRRNVVWALGEIEDMAAVPALSEALRDADVEIRRKAAWALGEIESPSALDALTGALRDADTEVRSTAVWAIGEIQPAAAPAALFALAGDPSAEVREHLAWALGEIEDPAGVPTLRRLMQDANASVREHAIYALADIHAPAAYEALVQLLEDPDPQVRKAAAEALGDADWDSDE